MENSTAHTPSTHSKKENGFNPVLLIWGLAGLLILVAGYLAIKAILAPFNEHKLILVNAPKEASIGSVATFTWKIDGSSTTITTTSVRLGATSNPGELSKETKPGDTSYTETLPDFANGKYNVPLTFVGNMKMPLTAGTYYYRVHALVDDKNYWTPEEVIEVKPADWNVEMVNAPQTAVAGKTATFTWKVNGPATEINETTVYFGKTSEPGSLPKTTDPKSTPYTADMIKDFANGKYSVPYTYVGNIQIATAGSYFYRLHALVNGENVWGDEGTLDVKLEPKTPEKTVERVNSIPTKVPSVTPTPISIQ